MPLSAGFAFEAGASAGTTCCRQQQGYKGEQQKQAFHRHARPFGAKGPGFRVSAYEEGYRVSGLRGIRNEVESVYNSFLSTFGPDTLYPVVQPFLS